MIFPIGLELRGRCCLVVGSGAEATLRVTQLQARGAQVRWLNPTLQAATPLTQPAAAQQAASLAGVHLLHAPFETVHLQAVWLAVLADRNATLAARMQHACEQQRIWFCAVDQPQFSSFSHVAQLDLEPVLITVSTDGKAPLLSRRVREELARLLDREPVRRFFEHIAALRSSTPPAERRQVLTEALATFRISGEVSVPSVPSVPATQSNVGDTPSGSGAG